MSDFRNKTVKVQQKVVDATLRNYKIVLVDNRLFKTINVLRIEL